MIATLLTNCTTVTSALVTQVKDFYDLSADAGYLEKDNLDKFYEFFYTKESIVQFKSDFLEISDQEKNDTLYFDIHEEASNQYFVHFTFKKKNVSSSEIVHQNYTKYTQDKKIKVMALRRLAKRIGKLLKNVKLARKTDNIQKQKKELNNGKE
jgi:hypothetical protein